MITAMEEILISLHDKKFPVCQKKVSRYNKIDDVTIY